LTRFKQKLKQKTGGITMSLTSTMFTGVTGLLNQAEAMNVIGNNIANVNTLGFKGSRMLFSDVLSTSVGSNSTGQLGHGVQIQKVDTIFSQSSLETTTLPTDVAIQGENFFAVAKPGTIAAAAVPVADAYYTRAGAFRVDSNKGLITPDNYSVLDSAAMPIIFTPTYVSGANTLDFQKVSNISAKGEISLLYSDANGNSATVYYNGSGAAPVPAAPTIFLGTAKIDNPPGMEKVGGTLFRSTGAITGGSGTPVISSQNGATEKVIGNNLELSNVDLANEFVKMILTQRAYSANSKTITTSDEMTQEILNLKR
jgi:flagellar hook protein FlgE